MRKLNEEDKEKIAEQVEYFRTEKRKFDAEVAKWDDTGNDIIVIAKHMCMIMMEMTDFTRYGAGSGDAGRGGTENTAFRPARVGLLGVGSCSAHCVEAG